MKALPPLPRRRVRRTVRRGKPPPGWRSAKRLVQWNSESERETAIGPASEMVGNLYHVAGFRDAAPAPGILVQDGEDGARLMRKAQSALSAAVGSDVDACHAGIQQASSATKTTVAAVPMSTAGSLPRTW